MICRTPPLTFRAASPDMIHDLVLLLPVAEPGRLLLAAPRVQIGMSAFLVVTRAILSRFIVSRTPEVRIER
jgi:hypothetical protein